MCSSDLFPSHDSWQKFNGEQKNPDDPTDFLIPTVSGKNVQNQTLWDYFGLPTNVNKVLKVNALPFRAYNLIFNEWFRDENLQESLKVPTGDGPDNLTDYNLVRRGKRHDYFTSCLPWPQKGPGVEISLGGSANVTITGNGAPYFERSEAVIAQPAGVLLALNAPSSAISSSVSYRTSASTGSVAGQLSWQNPALKGTADLSTATPISINDLRQAFQVQKLYERDARGGTRYTEILRSHFGVISPDARLQRPEYLGGSSARISINPVQQTSATNDTTPQGNLAAFGVASDSFHGFSKSFVEHGYI